MSAFYDRMRATAARLVTRFDQEGTEAVLRVVTPNPDPLLPPVITESVAPFRAVVRGVSAQLAAASPDLELTDLQVITDAVNGYVPETTQHVLINGTARGIIRVDAIPAAGDPVAYRFYVR